MLLKTDHEYLTSKGYKYKVVPGGAGAYLLIEDFELAPTFNRDRVTLMIQIPSGYNMAQLDMFYVDPEVRLRATNAHPQAASHMEGHLGRTWQRFSRHLRGGAWRPGIDGVPMFLRFIRAELQGRN